MSKEKTISTAIVVASLKKQASSIINKLKQLDIESKDEYAIAAQLMKSIKEKVKEAKEKEATIINPMQEAIAATKSLFTPFYDEAAELEVDTKKSMIAFLEKQEQIEKKLSKQLEEGKIKKLSTYMSKTADLQVSSVAQTRNVDELVIKDAKKIPREYMVVDEAKVKKALKAGIEVPGAELVKKKSIAI